MLTVFVTRHAQSETNRAGILSAAAPGPGLTDLGEQQAEQWAESLAERGVRRVYCSPYRRTRATARVLADRLGVTVEELHELRELDIGDWEGRPGNDPDVLTHPVFKAWMRGGALDERFQNGESAAEVASRARRALDFLSSRDSTPAAVVTHGAFMAIALSQICSPSDPVMMSIPRNTETREIYFDGDVWRTTLSPFLPGLPA